MKKALAIVVLALPAASAFAWKPSMHAAIAEMARIDAQDGFVEIAIEPSIRKKIGSIPSRISTLRGATATGVVTKRYPVDPELLEALNTYGAYYRAGTMGPDAYPDILTGQMIIHTDVPTNAPGGTNPWLQHLWSESLRFSGSRANRLRVRAFTAGYLTHGAGDMFGHSYVNHYAGGDFDTGSTNFLRHLVLEGYIAKRGPKLAETTMSISGIEDFLYKSLVDARAGTPLADRLYKGDTVERSLPYVFSKLRDRLAANIDDYERHKDDLGRTFSRPLIAYQREWLKDIDAGLRAWPALSHEVARRMVLFDSTNLDEQRKTDEVGALLTNYTNAHLLSMLGAPDAVGYAGARMAELQRLWESALYTIVSEEEIARMKQGLLDYVFENTFGMTYTEIKDYLKRPENYFDRVMGPNNRPKDARGRPKGEGILLADLNERLGLQTASDSFGIDDFAPAYNTLVMSKMILLSPEGVRQLMNDLDAPIPQTPPATFNRMLGYMRTFDGSAQWVANPEKMLLEQKGVFARVFRDQEGAEPPVVAPPPVPKSYRVTISVSKVKAMSGGIDIGSAPDFYPRFKIGTAEKYFDSIDNRDEVNPTHWTFDRTVTGSSVIVRIHIYDEDGNLAGSDDLCDAAPGDYNHIKLTVNLAQKTFTGATTGSSGRSYTVRGNEGDQVEVTFKVTVTEI